MSCPSSVSEVGLGAAGIGRVWNGEHRLGPAWRGLTTVDRAFNECHFEWSAKEWRGSAETGRVWSGMELETVDRALATVFLRVLVGSGAEWHG